MIKLSVFEGTLILLALAIFVSVLFRRLQIPTLLGYICVGILVGPYTLGWFVDSTSTNELAEFGVVLLLFTIGLEFSLARLVAMKFTVFGYGGLQVLLSIVITTAMGMLLGMTWPQSLVIGSVVAMSSTAIVTKLLADQAELDSDHGQNAMGILLFQDLAVIPLLIMIPSLAGSGGVEHPLFSTALVWALFKGILAVVIILSIGHWVLRPLFYQILARRSAELFTLTALFVTLSAAWLTQKLGLSLALGAFLAGMMIGETEFRHQIEADIRPFRDVLLALFFISIGLQFNPHILVTAWSWTLLLLGALIVFKVLLVSGLGRVLQYNKVTALRTGLLLAQGGEFGFAILALVLSYHLLPKDYGEVILAALVLSMIIAPFVIRYNQKIAKFIFPRSRAVYQTERQILSFAKELHQHVILCGYGRVGQNIAHFVEKAGVPFLAFDLDASRVETAVRAGERVYYADATRYRILRAAKLKAAKALVISFDNPEAAKKILQQVRRTNKRIPIIVRCYDSTDVEELYAYGATEVIPDTLEASLMLAAHVLLLMQIPIAQVRHMVDRSRHNRYDLLYEILPGAITTETDRLEISQQGLDVVSLTNDAYAVGKTLGEMHLDALHIKTTAMRRGHNRRIDPEATTELIANDVLVIFGALTQLKIARHRLLMGPVDA
ncbi:monovalent cation:proton antiporter family protein [soil metagenome]